MSLIEFKIFSSIIIWITTLVGAFLPLRARIKRPEHHSYYLSDAFANGIFLGAALFHMLPTASQSFMVSMPETHYPYAHLVCAITFVWLMFIEQLGLQLPQKKSGTHITNYIPYILTLILSIHALTTGMALGIDSHMSDALILVVAIMAHKSSESFALVANLNRSTLSIKAIITIFAVFSLMTPVGVVLGTGLSQHLHSAEGNLTEAVFNALAAGTFLYIATLHSKNHAQFDEHHHHHHRHSFGEFFALVIGLAIMGVIAIWL